MKQYISRMAQSVLPYKPPVEQMHPGSGKLRFNLQFDLIALRIRGYAEDVRLCLKNLRALNNSGDVVLRRQDGSTLRKIDSSRPFQDAFKIASTGLMIATSEYEEYEASARIVREYLRQGSIQDKNAAVDSLAGELSDMIESATTGRTYGVPSEEDAIRIGVLAIQAGEVALGENTEDRNVYHASRFPSSWFHDASENRYTKRAQRSSGFVVPRIKSENGDKGVIKDPSTGEVAGRIVV
jgi:hypothetical protein